MASGDVSVAAAVSAELGATHDATLSGLQHLRSRGNGAFRGGILVGLYGVSVRFHSGTSLRRRHIPRRVMGTVTII